MAQWRHPLARWSLAALAYSIAAADPAVLCAGWDSVVFADQLAEHFASNSFGDALYGALVALLLAPGVPSKVQKAAWQALDRERALHLLPPPRACIIAAGAIGMKRD